MDFNHPEDRYQNVEASQMLVQKETDCCSFDKRYVRADGRIVYVHIEVAGIWDAQKKLIGYFGFCLDISERQKNLASLEERERKYRYIYKHNNDLVFTLSKDLKLVFKNEAFDIALGIEGSSVENVGFSDFCTPADLVTINIMQDQILQGQREIIFELKLKNVNSEFIPYEARMSLILKDESQAYFRMFCRDLSYVYETEERIRAVEQKLAEYEEKFLKLRSLFRKQPNFMNLLSQEDLKDFDLL